MKLTVNTCYTRLLYLLTAGPEFGRAVQSFTVLRGPDFEHEGVAGYIETDVEFEIRDLRRFTNIWDAWSSQIETQKLNLYNLAKGLGGRK
jgi:hypothetical protein